MSPELREQIEVELEQIRRLLAIHRPLVEKSRASPPTPIELSALAAMLHSFYTGIENIFKRIAVEAGGSPPRGDSWHRMLLDAMVESRSGRSAVISSQTHQRLVSYLGFRHVFRNAYAFQLSWDRMSELVLNCDRTFELLEADLIPSLR